MEAFVFILRVPTFEKVLMLSLYFGKRERISDIQRPVGGQVGSSWKNLRSYHCAASNHCSHNWAMKYHLNDSGKGQIHQFKLYSIMACTAWLTLRWNGLGMLTRDRNLQLWKTIKAVRNYPFRAAPTRSVNDCLSMSVLGISEWHVWYHITHKLQYVDNCVVMC